MGGRGGENILNSFFFFKRQIRENKKRKNNENDVLETMQNIFNSRWSIGSLNHLINHNHNQTITVCRSKKKSKQLLMERDIRVKTKKSRGS